MKKCLIILSSMMLAGCGHFRQTLEVKGDGTNERPSKKYRISEVKILFEGKDVLEGLRGSDEATGSVRAMYEQHKKEFAFYVHKSYPDVFSEVGEPVAVIQDNGRDVEHLGLMGVLNIIVSIPTLLTFPIMHESEWDREITVVKNGKRVSPRKVVERIEMRKSGPIPIALCFPYSAHSDCFCVTGVKANNSRTEEMKINEGRANGMAIIKQLVELEALAENATSMPCPKNAENTTSCPKAEKAKSSVVELDQIPL